MSTRIGSGNPVGEAPGPSKLAEKLEVGPDGQVEQLTEAVTYRVVDSPGFVKELGGTWSECINNIDKPEFRERYLKTKEQMRDVELMALGHTETLVDLGRAQNEDRLDPAVESVLGAETFLKKEVPGLVRDVPFAALRETRGYYGFILSLQNVNNGFATGLEVLRTHEGQHLGGWARRVYGRLSGSLGQHQGLGLALQKLTDFVTGPAFVAVQTRKDNAFLSARVEKETLDKATVHAPQPTPVEPTLAGTTPQPTRPKGRL